MLNKNQTLQEGRFCILQQVDNNNADASYEAFDKDQNSNVLIKEIYCEKNRINEDSNQGLSVKADTVINLNHQSLLRVQNYFAEEDRHFLVMEKLKGNTLGELLRMQKNPFSLSDITNWAYQMLDAVSYLHSQQNQILHRDIKPDNTLLDSDGNIKLFIHSVVQNSEIEKKTITEDEQFDSTNLAFSPLEQVWEYLDLASRNVIVNNFDQESQKILEKPVDIRGDLYSIGATLYYLATAAIPFDALSRLIDKMDGNDDPLKTPNELNPNIPKAVSDVIMGALEIRRENRYSSAAIMKQILSAAISKNSGNKIQPPIVQKPLVKLNKQKPINQPRVVNPINSFEDKIEQTLEIPDLETQEPIFLKNESIEILESPKVEFDIEPIVVANRANSINKLASNKQVPKTKPWVFEKPKSVDKVQLEEPSKVFAANEQKQQLELIKKQLKEAEEKRIAAEKLVAKAEKLLNAQESLQRNKVETSNFVASKQDIQNDLVQGDEVFIESEEFSILELESAPDNFDVEEKTDFYSLDADEKSTIKAKDEFYKEVVESVIDEESLQDSVEETVPVESEFHQQADDSAVEPPPFLDVEKKIIPPANNEEFDDNFALPEDTYEEDDEAFVNKFVEESIEETSDDLFVEPEQKQRSSIKMAAGVIVLLLIGGAVWGVWTYNNSLNLQSNQVIKSTNDNSPIEIKNENESSIPTVETDVELTDADSESEIIDNDSEVPEDSTETTDFEPAVEVKTDTYNPPVAAPAKKTVYKPKAKTRRVVKPKRVKPRQPNATKAPKPTTPKKKAVTLDDLLNDN